jgi:PEP-CTERM motif
MADTYGIDTANGVAWAIVNHNSDFAIVTAMIPEPSTWMLLGLGLMALVYRRLRWA